MSYHSSRAMAEYLNFARLREEEKLPKKKFCARYARSVRRTFVVLTIVMGVIASLQFIAGGDRAVLTLFLWLTGLALLMLPTIFSYRCEVDGVRLRESYLIVFVPRWKEVLWKDIRWKKVRRDQRGNPMSIRLYNEKGKKVLSIGYDIAGLGPISRMAKEKGIPNRS